MSKRASNAKVLGGKSIGLKIWERAERKPMTDGQKRQGLCAEEVQMFNVIDAINAYIRRNCKRQLPRKAPR